MQELSSITAERSPADGELLRSFTASGDADAFRELVRRYTPIVYAAARRQLHDAHLAEDVTQAVFILLARKAKSLSGERLAGWLVNTTRLAAKAAYRAEARRRRREQVSAEMFPRSEPPMPSSEEKFAESADAVLCKLGETDRTAVTLRYLRGMSQREVAESISVSEDAIAQRLSRAIAKLRKLFARVQGGGSLAIASPTAMVEHLTSLAQNSPLPPAEFARNAADVALHSVSNATSVKLPVEIARRVISAWRWRLGLQTSAVAAISLLLILGGAQVLATRGDVRGVPGVSQSGQELGPIRVGVFISAYTAVTRPPENNAWYQQFRIVEELRDQGLTLIPIIEPGYDDQPQQKRLLKFYFAETTPIYVTDVSAMKDLDTIVASAAHDVEVKTLQCIEAAVSDGTGLYVRGCLGGCTPGMTSDVAVRLRGYESGVTAQNPSAQECRVVASHPLLGDLSGKVDQTLAIFPAGSWGPIRSGGVPLIRLTSTDSLRTVDNKPLPNRDRLAGDILYTSTLGKGRIVGFNFPGATPEPLQRATGNRFVARIVQWTAQRPIE